MTPDSTANVTDVAERRPVNVYVASRASVPERSAKWRQLHALGYPIISSWIYEAGVGETADMGELWTRITREIEESTGLLLYVGAGDLPLKGALVEVGMALARGIPVVVVADPNVTRKDIGSWTAHPLVTCTYSIDRGFWLLGYKEPQ